MKRFLLILAAVAAIVPSTVMAQDICGTWSGELDISGQKLGLSFNIRKADNGYAATMDVPQQGARGLAVSGCTFDGLNMKMDIATIGASFEGIFVMGMISGKFFQSGLELPLVLKKEELKAPDRPQDPKGPFPYECREVTFENPKAGVKLAGTLTIPQGDGPFPAVVLVTGSGVQNRDEEIMGHRPFAVIADYLTRKGIAVLRYDDRGVGGSERGPEGSTTVDLSYDAEAAVDALFEEGRIIDCSGNVCREVNRFSRIGILGHSEGAQIAFILASKKKAAFVVSLGGPAVKGSEILRAQQDALYKASGLPQEAIDANAAFFSNVYGVVEESKSLEAAEPELRKMAAMLPAQQQKQFLAEILNPWMYAFIKLDSEPYISATRCPALILNGSRDLQVVAAQNLPVFRKIAADKKKDFTIREIEGLNHLFQHCNTGLPTEYGQISETIAPEVLEAIVEFIKATERK